MIRTPRLAFVLACSLLMCCFTPPLAAQPKPPKQAIDQAVERGIAFLRTAPWDYSKDGKKSGDWQYDVGSTALLALAMMESGVSPRDPAIVAAARVIRAATPKLTKTYAVSLCIMFMDRYGGTNEADTIRDLAYRLVAGQDNTSWGWSYECPLIKDHRSVLSFLQANKNRRDFGEYKPTGNACNSNSQFAVLALWIARRQNVPVDYTLARAEARFRNTQNSDGGWGYQPAAGSSPSMTCSGLLGLAIGFGNRSAQLKSGGKLEDSSSAKAAPMKGEDIRVDPKVELAKAWVSRQLKGKPNGIGNWPYFLWSLQRVGAIYGFDELDKVNWYDWGATDLIMIQKDDGSWDGGYPPQINTAFALLFLRKPNLARDLSGIAQLKVGDKDLGANQPPDAAKLAAELPTAKPERQQAILKLLEETKDPTGTFTQQLADLISTLQGELQDKARLALARRLSRQSVAALRDYLSDENLEYRRAGIRAAGIKPAPDLLPDIIPLLDNPAVAADAEEALKTITKQDLGKSQQAWRDYLAKNKK